MLRHSKRFASILDKMPSRTSPTRGLHISFMPAASENTASARLRVYSLARMLKMYQVTVSIGYSKEADVVVVQKRANAWTVGTAALAHLRGQPIIYDVDDLGPALWSHVKPASFGRMCALANLITVASNAQAEYLNGICRTTRIEVLPCMVDYSPVGPVMPRIEDNRLLRIIWFGTTGNFPLLERYIPTIAGLEDTELIICIHPSLVESCRIKYPQCTFIEWSIHSFINTLQSCDLALLMHDGTQWDRAKNNNKMITSIVWGVPALVSDTPDYSQTARAAGIASAIFRSKEQLLDRIEHFKSAVNRRQYLDTAQPKIWAEYSPDAIAKAFLHITTELLAVHQPKARITRFKHIWSSVGHGASLNQ